MIEKQWQPMPNRRINVQVDVEKLMANPEFRAQQARLHASLAELQAEKLQRMYEEWVGTYDPQEIAETLDYVMKALEEDA